MLQRTPALGRATARLIDQAVAIQSVDSQEARSLGYTARILTIATLPHRAQPGDHYERVNGGYRLTVQAMPGAGLPYGSYPRLLLSWLSTQIVRTRERELELGPSMACGFHAKPGHSFTPCRAGISRDAGPRFHGKPGRYFIAGPSG